MGNNYQDYVIRNGSLVGKFDEMYQNCEDPWNLSKRNPLALDLVLLRHSCELIRSLEGHCSPIELGCGPAYSIDPINDVVERVCGIDVSETAISQAKERYPNHDFRTAGIEDIMHQSGACADLDLGAYNTIIMCNITWYILEALTDYKAWLLEHWRGKYVVHILATYPEGQQKYGADFFTNEAEIDAWWDLTYVETGHFIQMLNNEEDRKAYFLAKI